MIAVDVAILVPEPVKSLAIGLSKQINTGHFHLNKVDILPHITLGMGFVDRIENLEFRIENLAKKFQPFEVEVERVEGRYLMCGATEALYALHKAVCDVVPFERLKIQRGTLKEVQQGSTLNFAYFVKPGERISGETVDYTNDFVQRNAYENWIPHMTLGWDDNADTSKLKARLPQSFTADEISICQLGDKNTCRKVLARVEFGK